MAQNSDCRNEEWKDHPLFKEYEESVSETTDRCARCGSEDIYATGRSDFSEGDVFCNDCQDQTDYDILSFTEWCDLKGIDYEDIQ